MGDLIILGDLKLKGAKVNVLGEIKTICKKAELVVANLEGPIVKSARPRSDKIGVCHCSDDQVLALIEDLSIKLLILGNNHIYDFGDAGLVETIEFCNRNGIAWVGARTSDGVGASSYKNEALRIAFLSYSHREGPVSEERFGSGPYALPDNATVSMEVERLVSEGYRVFVAYHGGEEYFNYPWPRRLGWSKRVADAGASVVYGTHSHSPQPIFVNGASSYIASGLGNLFFHTPRQEKNSKGQQGLVLRYNLENGTLGAHMLRACFASYELELAGTEEGSHIVGERIDEEAMGKSWEEESRLYALGRLNRLPGDKGHIGWAKKAFGPSYRRVRFAYAVIVHRAHGLRDLDMFCGAIPVFGRRWARRAYNAGYRDFRF